MKHNQQLFKISNFEMGFWVIFISHLQVTKHGLPVFNDCDTFKYAEVNKRSVRDGRLQSRGPRNFHLAAETQHSQNEFNVAKNSPQKRDISGKLGCLK